MATSNKDFKAVVAARKEGRLRPLGVPQVDPVAQAIEAAQGTAELTPEVPTPVPQASTEETSASLPVTETTPARRISLTPADTSEQVRPAGFHMYPSRHRQLRDLAFMEDRKPWEIVEQALAEYVELHYPSAGG